MIERITHPSVDRASWNPSFMIPAQTAVTNPATNRANPVWILKSFQNMFPISIHQQNNTHSIPTTEKTTLIWSYTNVFEEVKGEYPTSWTNNHHRIVLGPSRIHCTVSDDRAFSACKTHIYTTKALSNSVNHIFLIGLVYFVFIQVSTSFHRVVKLSTEQDLSYDRKEHTWVLVNLGS